ncbi:MAG: hypothetical protein EXS05_22190 [Planctomycetaceae bacterium]|nr:hypothetical protein [Planctomycetaceae bacterium]
MTEVTQRNFGFLIAYVLPGLVALIALSGQSSAIRSWLAPATAQGPTIGGFFFATLAAVAAGMTVSAVRWLLLDSLHHQTGVKRATIPFARLQVNLTAFEGAVENHYRYYQFYGNTMIALLFYFVVPDSLASLAAAGRGSTVAVICIIEAVFFLASRDSLKKYYARTESILGKYHQSTERRHDQRLARNGPNHDEQEGG